MNDFLEFCRGVSVWPTGSVELNSIADKLLNQLFKGYSNIRLAAAHSSQLQEEVGVQFSKGAVLDNFNSNAFEDFLIAQSKEQASSTWSMTQVKLNRESLMPSWSDSSRSTYLTYVAVRGDSKLLGAVKDETIHKDYGWIAVGTEKPMTAREESLLLLAAHHLGELAMLSQLESVIEMRGQFLSIASHELKTPLTSIYGLLQLQERMIRKKSDNAEEQRERQHSFLKMVIRQVERLNELIDGLLDLSRIQNGRFMVEPTETDIANLLREVVGARLSVIAVESGVKLHVDAPEKFIASVDPVRMEELINNLVMNAIRFSPEGGVVWVKLKQEDGSFRLTIRDQGPSVSMEDRERIFQPFERAQRTSRLGGLGLGLFISRQIALLHGGNVSLVESVPGKGNVFEAYLPTRVINDVSVSA